MGADLAHFEDHYEPRHPDLAEHMWDVVEHLRARCPVTRSDGMFDYGGQSRQGFWVLTRYADIYGVLQDWEAFSSEDQAGGMHMPPITIDPPLQREFRRLLNPFLTPQAVAAYEEGSRQVVTELIDGFIEEGKCDLVSQFARLFPGRMLYQVMLGIDNVEEVDRNLAWIEKMIFDPGAPDLAEAMLAWTGWIHEFMAARRAAPPRGDIIDALLYGTVAGRPLSDGEIAGTIQILILGGFDTTAHATTATMLKLIEHPAVQQRLREHPSEISQVFDEVLRLEPPVISLSRVCRRDIEINGTKITEGDVVLLQLGGANRDPSEFEHPAQMDIDRSRNRHVSFGSGPHRCVGSNVARLNLRVAFEEILSRLQNIRITEGESAQHAPAWISWGLEYLPLSFQPGPRIGEQKVLL